MRPVLALTALALLSVSARADHCESWESSVPEVDLVGEYYVDQDCFYGCVTDTMPALWIYEETNGLGGLQRGDEHVDDTCHGSIAADRIVF